MMVWTVVMTMIITAVVSFIVTRAFLSQYSMVDRLNIYEVLDFRERLETIQQELEEAKESRDFWARKWLDLNCRVMELENKLEAMDDEVGR